MRCSSRSQCLRAACHAATHPESPTHSCFQPPRPMRWPQDLSAGCLPPYTPLPTFLSLTAVCCSPPAATKADEVARKLSVLASFTEKPEEQKEKKEAAAAKKEEAHDEVGGWVGMEGDCETCPAVVGAL